MEKIKFRCSSLGHLLTGAKQGITDKQTDELNKLMFKEKKTDKQVERLEELISKRDAKPEISETAKTHLIDVYVRNKYNRFTEINAKQLGKGNETEDDSITTVSRITKLYFEKNMEQLENDFIKGTPDIFKGPSIRNAEMIRDTKSSWDIYTFNRSKYKTLNPLYYWQLQGYADLTGAKQLVVDYCLNNTPYHIVNNELFYESKKHPEGNTPNWIELQIIANHVYDINTFNEYIEIRGCTPNDEFSHAVYQGFVDVPLAERHKSFEFERNDDDINLMHQFVELGREYINENFY